MLSLLLQLDEERDFRADLRCVVRALADEVITCGAGTYYLSFFIGEGDVDGFACSDSDGTGQDIYVRFSLVYTKPAASP